MGFGQSASTSGGKKLQIIFVEEETIYTKESCFLKLKGLEPFSCKIVWRKQLDKSIFRVGLQYQTNN